MPRNTSTFSLFISPSHSHFILISSTVMTFRRSRSSFTINVAFFCLNALYALSLSPFPFFHARTALIFSLAHSGHLRLRRLFALSQACVLAEPFTRAIFTQLGETAKAG